VGFALSTFLARPFANDRFHTAMEWLNHLLSIICGGITMFAKNHSECEW
jgi:hypothetical protein